MLSNVSALGVLILFRSLATIIRRHVSLQGPLLVEFSSFSLTAVPSVKAQGGENNSMRKKTSDATQAQTETHQTVFF